MAPHMSARFAALRSDQLRQSSRAGQSSRVSIASSLDSDGENGGPCSPSHGCGGLCSPSSAEIGMAAAIELVEGHFRRAERSLVVEHTEVIRLISELFDAPGKAGGTILEPDPPAGAITASLARAAPATLWQRRSLPVMSGSINNLKLESLRTPTASNREQALVETDSQDERSPRADLPDAPAASNTRKSNLFSVLPVFKQACTMTGSTKYGEYEDATALRMKSGYGRGAFGDDASQPDGCVGRLIQHPNNLSRAVWELVSVLLVLYDSIMVPFDFFDPERTAFMLAMTWVTRLFWTFDIPLSFLSGFVTADGTIEVRPGKIALRYLRSWFFLDIIVTAVDWIESMVGSAMSRADVARMSKTTKVLRIIRLARLARVYKVGEIASLLMERLPSEKLVVFIGVMKLIVFMLGLAHLVACAWYWVGVELRPVDRHHWNWLQKFEFEGESLDYKYIMALRWSLSQFAGGMDEVTPVSLAEHIFACIVYICAFWSGAVFTGILTSHFTQLYILGNQTTQQVASMRRYLTQNGISKALTVRITRNAQHCLRMRQPATGLLGLVSEPLRIELNYELYFPMLSRHEFFADYMRFCPFILRRICHEAMTTHTFARDDTIFHFGEAASKMLIVRSGTLAYSWGASRSELLGEGRWLSEPPLWTQWAHKGILTACDDSILFAVNAELFQRIVTKFDLTVFNPGEYAISFVRRLNKASVEELTDLPVEHSGSRSSFVHRRSLIIRRVSAFKRKLSVSAMYSVNDCTGEQGGSVSTWGARRISSLWGPGRKNQLAPFSPAKPEAASPAKMRLEEYEAS